MNTPTTHAFTLLELLVVIAIIGLLSSLIVAGVNSAREKAQAARIVQDFQTIEQALYLFADAKGIARYWNCGGGCTIDGHTFGGDPSIASLVQYSELSEFLPTAPESPIGGTYIYDYDGDDRCPPPACWTWEAANIVLNRIPQASLIGSMIDEMIDGGDGPCEGKVGWTATAILYHINCSGKF